MSRSDPDYGGQRRNMEDESMVGTLSAQASVIWPAERELLRRRMEEDSARAGGRRPARVLDLCCGTGEVLRRYRDDFRPHLAVGLDLFPGHLRRAEGPRVLADAYRTPFRDGSFDLVLVRHVLQALPDPVGLLREARRILAPEGRLHLLVEDYAAILFDTEDYATADHFREVARPFRERGTDLYQGRRAYRHLREAGFDRIALDPILVDTLSADRPTFAAIFRHWRDGYAATLAERIGTSEAEVRRRFDEMIATILDPGRYAAWLLFAISAR